MKPKGHKAKAQRQKIENELGEAWARDLQGLEGVARDKKECELLGIEYGKPWTNSQVYFKSELPKGYHDYIDTLTVFEPQVRWSIFEALLALQETISQESFELKKSKMRITLGDLKGELQALAKEPVQDQLKILTALPLLWKKSGYWRDLRDADDNAKQLATYHGTNRAVLHAKEKLEQAIKDSRDALKQKQENEVESAAERERSLVVEAARRMAIADDKGHTAPLVPEPAWLLRRAKEQLPQTSQHAGYIWDVVEVSRENEHTWPSMHDMVMGLGWSREKIEAEIKAQTAGWDIPPDTGRRKPGKAKRYSPEVLRWLIGRWLKQRHADLPPAELAHVTGFLQHIQSRLPQ